MIAVRRARSADAPLVLTLIRELAEYEKLAHACVADEARVRALLFAAQPRAFCEIAEFDSAAVGYALWFYNVSTFECRAGMYLEDIYVRPEMRGRGVGKALMAALAQRCAAEDLPRMDWAVLDWNAPSIAFYDRLGAEAMTDWTTRRLSGAALAELATTA